MDALSLPADSDPDRLGQRRLLLDRLDVSSSGDDPFRQQRRLAFEMLTSGKVADAFRLEREPDRVRDRYGRNQFGQSLLLARRLVRAGVPVVQANMGIVQSWDTHGDNWGRLKNRLLPWLDRGLAALIDDLEAEGRMGDTLVAALGEFARTPKVSALPGASLPDRHHRGGPVGASCYNTRCVADPVVSRETVMSFSKFGLPAPLVRNALALGYVTPTPVQSQSIPAARAGRDLLATARTGTGKTAAFLLPLLERLLVRPRGATGGLVLAPTRELAQQVEGVARALGAGTPLHTALVVGGAAQAAQERALRAGAELVVATPGRLLALLAAGHSLPALVTLVLDEADQLFDLGFFPDIKRILVRLPVRRQTLLFSATMPPEVARLGRSLLRDPLEVAVGPQGAAAEGVTHTAYPVPAHRKAALLRHLLGRGGMGSVLVFTRTRRGARRLARALDAWGCRAAELHGDCTPAQRARVMGGFRAGTVPVLVATNIAARGLDVRRVSHVVNYDVPAAQEEYVHRVGRTGRAGDKGEALLLVAPEEGDLLARIERRLGRRLPRLHLPNFDYAAPPGPKQPAGPRPGAGDTRGRRPSARPGGRR